MATFKPTVRSVRNDGFMQVYIRVSHHKRHGYIKTDKMVTKRELNKQGEIKEAYYSRLFSRTWKIRIFGVNFNL